MATRYNPVDGYQVKRPNASDPWWTTEEGRAEVAKPGFLGTWPSSISCLPDDLFPKGAKHHGIFTSRYGPDGYIRSDKPSVEEINIALADREVEKDHMSHAFHDGGIIYNPELPEAMAKAKPGDTIEVHVPYIPPKKDGNPKDAIGSNKVGFSALPWRVLLGVSMAMSEGAFKYGRHNYRIAGLKASVYFDAVLARHLTPWWEGEDIDAASGLHHMDKAIAGLMCIRDSILNGNWIDDRPPSTTTIGAEILHYNSKMEELIEKYPNPKAPCMEKKS